MKKSIETCDILIVHQEKVDNAKKFLKKISIEEQMRYFKIFADDNRLKILYAIISEQELCVCDISEIIGASIATTSHHLQTLKKRKILDSKKDGKLSYYFLIDSNVIDLLYNDFKLLGV